MERLDWDDYYLDMLEHIGKRSTCDRGKSGCVITQDNRIVSTGYVGAPEGFPHCDEVGHQMIKITHVDGIERDHCARTIHAEANAISYAARKGIKLEGATLYCKMTPCPYICAPLIVACGISKVVCLKGYQAGGISLSIFKQANIELKFRDESIEEY